jgi:hypothetical protein
MANILGFLGVELGLNTASFKGGCDKATYAAKQFSGQLRQEFSQLGASFSQLGSQLAGSLGPLGGVVSSLTQSLNVMGSSIAAAGRGAPALMAIAGVVGGLGFAAVGAAVGLVELAKGGADVVEQLNLLSAKTGISIEHLQTLKAAGDVVNLPIESLARGFKRFSKALADGGDDTKRTTSILKELGVTSHDPYEAFLQLADGISKVEDPNKRAAEASALLGMRVSQQLLPELEKGRASFERWSTETKVFGAAIGVEAVANQEKFKVSQERLSMSWDRLKVSSGWIIPWLADFNTGLSLAITHPLYLLGGDLSSAKPKAAADQDADKKAAIRAKALADADEAASAALKVYQNTKAGGVAGIALANAQQNIKDLLQENTAESNTLAAAEQRQIPYLEKQASLEKQRLAATMNLSQTTKAFVDEQAVTVTKSYGEALKALGPESAEAARQQAVSAEVEKLANKQRQEGIYGTKQAVEALKEMRTAANDASLANMAFSKSAEASKLLESFSDRMQESTDKMHAAAAATDKIGKAQADLDFGLDKAKQALADQGSAYQELLKSATATDEEKKRAADLLEKNTRALLADTDALEKNKEALAEKISAETITKQEQVNAATKDYLDLLSAEPEWEAKADHAARQEATSIGLKGTALKKFLDLKHQEADMQHSEVAPKEEAAKALEPGTKDAGKQAAANLAAIRAMSAGYLQQGGNVKVLDKALMEADLRVQQLKAANGSMFAGAKAGMLQFVMETKTLGQAIQQNIVKGLNNVNSAFAKSIVEGKNLGAAMKGVAKGIAEDMLQAGLKMVESWILQHIIMSTVTKTTAATDAATQIALNKTVGMSAAGLAGANAVASFSLAPWPIDLGAPAFGASMFAEALSFAAFEQGGIVPKTGMAKVHEKEMVLPRPIAEKVTKMADPDAGRMANRKNVTVNMNISTPNASSFGHSQNQIQTKAHLAATKMAKRNG